MNFFGFSPWFTETFTDTTTGVTIRVIVVLIIVTTTLSGLVVISETPKQTIIFSKWKIISKIIFEYLNRTI